MQAICIRCGASKEAPWQLCPECGLEPVDEDLVKSVYLSVGRFDDPERMMPYEDELEDYQQSLRNGGNIEYDEQDLERLREQKALVESVTTWDAVRWLLNFLRPAIIFLSLLALLNYLLGLFLR